MKEVDILEIKEVKIPAIIDQEVYDKIEYVCKVIPNVEWSGAVLYVVEGSIKDYKNMRIIVKDIIVMAKSSATYTKFTFNEKKREGINIDRHMDYCMENEEALNWKIGFIHSHNTFGTFFSPTDNDELVENSESHNYYFSLITNNAMELIAKIGFRIKLETKISAGFEALDEDGNKYDFLQGEYEIKKEKVVFIDCDVIFPSKKTSINPSFLKNIEDVIKKSEEDSSVQSQRGHFIGRERQMNNIIDDYDAEYDWRQGIKNTPVYDNDTQRVFVNTMKKYFELRYAKNFKEVLDYLRSKDRIIDNDKFAEDFIEEYESVFIKDYSSIIEIIDSFEEIVIDYNLGNNLLKAVRNIGRIIFNDNE